MAREALERAFKLFDTTWHLPCGCAARAGDRRVTGVHRPPPLCRVLKCRPIALHLPGALTSALDLAALTSALDLAVAIAVA